MSVDLDRLREAREYAGANTAEREYLAKTADAVLDAPTVWWCEAYRGGAGHMDEPCVAGSKHDYPMPCRWVALVPVKGGQE